MALRRSVVSSVSESVSTSPSVQTTGGVGFNPLSLFAGGEVGGYYDPSDLSSLWQDVGGTSAVTADGQTVNRMDDLSGNGLHLRSDAAGALATAPLYKTNGTQHWLEAVDAAAASIGLLGSEPSGTIPFQVDIELWYAAAPEYTGVSTVTLWGVRQNTTSTVDYLRIARRGDTERPAIQVRGGNAVPLVGSTSVNGTSGDWETSAAQVARLVWESATFKEEMDGVENIGPSSHGWTTETMDGQIMLGSSDADKTYAALAIDRTLTAQEAADIESWLAGKMP